MHTHLLMVLKPGYYVVSLCWTRLLHDLDGGLSDHSGTFRLARLGSIFGLLATQRK
jgi:hypothetical protein